MLKIVFAAVLASTAMVPAAAIAAEPAAATATALNTTDTTIGDLLDNPAARAVLMKHIPEVVSNQGIDMARAMTLRQIQSFAADVLTDEKLAQIDTDLAAIGS